MNHYNDKELAFRDLHKLRKTTLREKQQIGWCIAVLVIMSIISYVYFRNFFDNWFGRHGYTIWLISIVLLAILAIIVINIVLSSSSLVLKSVLAPISETQYKLLGIEMYADNNSKVDKKTAAAITSSSSPFTNSSHTPIYASHTPHTPYSSSSNSYHYSNESIKSPPSSSSSSINNPLSSGKGSDKKTQQAFNRLLKDIGYSNSKTSNSSAPFSSPTFASPFSTNSNASSSSRSFNKFYSSPEEVTNNSLIRENDALDILHPLDHISNVWIDNLKKVILKYLKTEYSKFNLAVGEMVKTSPTIGLDTRQRYLSNDDVERCRNILSLNDETLPLTAFPHGANVQTILRKIVEPQTAPQGMNPATIKVDTVRVYCQAHRLFCNPQSSNRVIDIDTAISNLGQPNKSFVSRIKEIINPKKNTVPFGSSGKWAIDADICVNTLLIMCASNDISRRGDSSIINYVTGDNANIDLKRFIGKNDKVGLYRQIRNQEPTYQVFYSEDRIQMLNTSEGRENCYESILVLFILMIKLNIGIDRQDNIKELLLEIFDVTDSHRDHKNLITRLRDATRQENY